MYLSLCLVTLELLREKKEKEKGKRLKQENARLSLATLTSLVSRL